MKLQKIFSRILDGLILLVFVLFFASAGIQDRSTSGWYQQFFPNLNGSSIKDITFLDSLTGFAVTTTNSSVQAYILKTTNGGDNWNIVHTYVPPSVNSGFMRIMFADSNVGFASTSYVEFFKTTNGGINWINISEPPWALNDMYVLNKDTIFGVSSSGFGGGVFRSTNGGLSWQTIWTSGSSGNPGKIHMYDKNLGFSCIGSPFDNVFYRTTNGGLNWSNLGDSTFYGIQFYDSLTGWKQTISGVKKTTDGGLTWVRQSTPIFFVQSFTDLTLINKDTLWYVGPAILRYNQGWYVICRSTNGGISWGYQLPDTSIKIAYYHIDFINKYNGWAYGETSGVHTKLGGNDSTIFTSINNNLSTEITDYQLFQNYPNPFNATSNIKYKISKSSYVRIEIMNILGMSIQTLVNKKQNPGNYEINFNGENLGSGIYFYSMIIDGKIADTKRMIMIK